MQFKKGADNLIGSKARVGVLRLLVKFPHRGFTGREVARFAGISASQALIALNDLRHSGVAQSRRIGRSTEWKANAESALFRLLAPVVREGALLAMAAEDIRGAFSGLSSLKKLVLFGSIARGDEKPHSDIDLLVVLGRASDKPKAEQIAHSLSVKTSGKYGNPLSALIYTEAEMRLKNPMLLNNIGMEGIVLFER